MENTKPIYIIFGASGDLTKRYLLPAVKNLLVTKDVGAVIPISRADYGNLKNLIKGEGEKIFHLAIPPLAVPDAVRIISENFGKNKIKILLEKPFGSDLESAKDLVSHIDKYFSEDQIYRIDHYLAKESLERVTNEEWDRDNVLSIEITLSEKIDIEGRINFYESTGALKDMVQSHILEILAVVMARSFNVAEREELLKSLQIVCDISKNECVKRGQYEGYKGEVNNPKSTTETFVSINLVSNEPSWRGVSIVLSTGKAMASKFTEIKIKYKNGNEKTFNIQHEPGAYERVVKAAVGGNHSLFISSTEVLESWRILDAVQKTWKDGISNLVVYRKGSNIEDILKMN